MVKSCRPDDYPQFDKLPQEIINEKIAKLEKWIWNNASEIPRDRLFVSEDCVLNIIDLVEIPPPNTKARQISEVNAAIAVRMLFNAVNRIRHNQGKERTKLINTSNLIHSFRYRDISKEAVMVLFENLISA
jgi:hypothetical protein